MTHSNLGAWRKPQIVELNPADYKERKVYKDYLKSLKEDAYGEESILSPEFSEDRLALRFAKRYGDDLRYVASWGKWFAWIGTHWQHEDTLAVFDMARKICRGAANLCNKASEAKAIAKAKTVAAIEQLAKSDRAIAATIGQWDADKGLLNTPGGIIHVKIGAPQPHHREDYCTKITAVTPGGDCPMFLDFLHTIFAGDNELIDLAIA
jgi:putative DNA primase/helicase